MNNDFSKLRLFSIACPLCEGQKFSFVRNLNSYSIVRCRNCDFQFINPRPDEQTILNAYYSKSENDALSFSNIFSSDSQADSYSSWTGRYVLKQLFQKKPSGAFLDIGADHGWVVKESLRLGYNAYGYEFGENRAFHKDPVLRDRIYTSVPSITKSGQVFDVLFLSAVLEHIYYPVTFLKDWLKFLKPGGLFVLAAIPNMKSIFIKTGVDSWDGNIPLIHLNYFTSNSLRFLINQVDCDIEDEFTMGAPCSISLRNIFNQKKFDDKFWGDNSKTWNFAKEYRTRSPRSQNTVFEKWVTPLLNHGLRIINGGANIYLTLRKR